MKLDSELDLRGDTKTTLTRFSYGALAADSIRLLLLHLRCVNAAEEPCPYSTVNHLANKLQMSDDAVPTNPAPDIAVDVEAQGSPEPQLPELVESQGSPEPQLPDLVGSEICEDENMDMDMLALDAVCSMYENASGPNENAPSVSSWFNYMGVNVLFALSNLLHVLNCLFCW